MLKKAQLAKTKAKSTNFESVVEALDVIKDVESSLQKALDTTIADQRENDALLSKWQERSVKASGMLKQATTPEGLQAMEVLEAKASSFADFYLQTGKRLNDSLTEIRSSMAKVKQAKDHLTAVEKTQALDVTLQKMASESNIVLATSPTLDHRQIAQVIYTAKALAELRASR